MAMTKSWREANEAEGMPCPSCGAAVHAFYRVTVCAPYPFVTFTKASMRSKNLSIVAVDHDLVTPMCVGCGWRETRTMRTKSDVIQTLMRELINRGMKPSDLQALLNKSPVGAVDLMAAAYPKLAEQ